VIFLNLDLLWYPFCNTLTQRKKIVIEADLSDYISDRNLFQDDPSSILYLVAYFSKKYLLPKCNYIIFHKEQLAVILGFEECTHMLKAFSTSLKS
jgi:hypothetical protein